MPKIIQNLKNDLRNIEARGLTLKNKKIGLAVSGGVDSMVLLDAFCKLSKEFDLKLFALHYNHKWRKESYLDLKPIRKYCKKHGLQLLYGENKSKVINNEEAARNQRYLFFKQCAKKHLLTAVCTAHHEDDQLETILFRLARGTGPKGLLPIKELFDFSCGAMIYRPFLKIKKEEIYNYAKQNRLLYIEDKTNHDLKYKRNLIRKKIIPLINKLNDRASENIFLFSDIAYSQDMCLNKHFEKLFKVFSTANKKKHLLVQFKIRKFLQLDEYTQKAFLYWILTRCKIKGNLNKIRLILKSIQTFKSIDLSKEIYLRVDKVYMALEKKQAVTKTSKNKSLTKKAFLSNGREQIVSLSDNLNFEVVPFKQKFSNKIFPRDKDKVAYVDLSVFKQKKLVVRSRKAKDIFQPLGFVHSMKLKKYLINKKIPKFQRNNLPLLCFNNEVLWIPGYALSHKLKVQKKPSHILKLSTS